LKGGKPVIYLFAPNVVDAHWEISAVYPTVQQTKSIAGGDTVEWQVRVHPDGTFTERTTGLDVAYLFWEALCVFRFPLSPQDSLTSPSSTNHDVPMTPRNPLSSIQLNLPLHNQTRSPLRPAISPPRTPSFFPSTPSRPTSTRRSANSASIPRRARRS
ncbi:hypothetical protein C8R44DRAFT_812092, partial [Mycena epipterygia]